MSSATSTERQGFRPGHFFVLACILAATAAVLMARQTSVVNVVLLTAAIWAAGLAGLALHRTLSPLTASDADVGGELGARTRAALEREKALVLRSIKELEFDRAMGKIAQPDFEEMVRRLRSRALALLAQLEADDGSGYRELIERELRARLATGVGLGQPEPTPPAPAPPPAQDGAAVAGPSIADTPAMVASSSEPTVCGVCDTPNDADSKFCKECGEPLAASRATSDTTVRSADA